MNKALELYIADLEKLIVKTEIKNKKEIEKQSKKIEQIREEYNSINDIMEAYGCGAITNSKKEQLIDLFKNGESLKNETGSMGKYLNLLKRDLRSLRQDIRTGNNCTNEVAIKEHVEATTGIRINDKYKIISEPLNVVIMEQRIPKKIEGQEEKEPIWVAISWHPTIEMALKSLINREINGTGLKDLESVNEKIIELKSLIEEVSIEQRN